jgi:hypothetical protein
MPDVRAATDEPAPDRTILTDSSQAGEVSLAETTATGEERAMSSEQR